MTVETKFDIEEEVYIIYNEYASSYCDYAILKGKVSSINFFKTKKIKQRYDIKYTRWGLDHVLLYVKPKHIFKSKKAAEKYISKKIIKRIKKEC